MGVRDSQLDAVPSLALGTSPVTLKEMVSAYGTIANLGGYVEPLMVTRIEDRNGNLLAEFKPAAPKRELPADTARTLVDVMRDVVSRGTGASIRTRFGVRGDVAGKTGTTQGNADGWFILIQPQLVAGAWVGFNDSRVTLRSDYWGQGAHSALPIVGDFFQRAQRSRLIDSHLKFDTEQQPGWFAERAERMRDWIGHLFTRTPAQPDRQVAAHAPVRRAPVAPVAPAASVVAAPAASEAAGASAVQGEARALPPLLPAPGSESAPAPAPGNSVDGETHGGGAAALAPTPTPDDVVPPDAGGQSGEGPNSGGGAN
jgi:penicillin-binding protein 1A